MAQQPVIPPVAIEEFTCAGNGLLYEGHPRESPADLRLLLLPSGGKNGISDRDRKVYTMSYSSSTNGPKPWWLAQNKFYGLAQAKATPIGTLRSKLEDALRSAEGMRVPEKILNLESEGNRKYKELNQIVLQETQAPKKGPAKAAKATAPPMATTSKQPNPRAPKVAASSSKTNDPLKPRTAGKASVRNAAAAGVSRKDAPAIQPTAPIRKFHRKTTSDGPPPQILLELDDVPGRYEDFGEIFQSRTKQTARKKASGVEPRKRDRSPDGSMGGPSNKRMRADNADGEFRYLAGTYDISAPRVSEGWPDVGEDFLLVIKLDSERRLFGTFDLGIYSGVLRSTVDIEPRADGASAKFEWCGRQDHGGSEAYPPREGMTGVLRFTRRKRDETHTVKGSMEYVPSIGKCEFTGDRVGVPMAIPQQWEDYNWAAIDRANKARGH